jgi:hypothetical protein
MGRPSWRAGTEARSRSVERADGGGANISGRRILETKWEV